MNAGGQEAAFRQALDDAWGRQIRWDLPDLTGTERVQIVGTLIRDRALTLIQDDLVSPQSQRARRAPWGEQWARDWFDATVLPAARLRSEGGWWVRRAPREALSWAIVIDPEGAGRAGHR